MDPFRLGLALGPVAIYLVLLGAIQLCRRPLLVSGSRDLSVLGLAVSGLVLVGPMELFFPVSASAAFGPFVWAFLTSLYFLAMFLVSLLMRPRLVIYNLSRDALRPVLADVAVELDADARWAGDSLVLPRLGVFLFLESTEATRSISLISAGPQQNPQGWRQLEVALAESLATVAVPRARHGLALVAAGAAMAAMLLAGVLRSPVTLAQSLAEIFRW